MPKKPPQPPHDTEQLPTVSTEQPPQPPSTTLEPTPAPQKPERANSKGGKKPPKNIEVSFAQGAEQADEAPKGVRYTNLVKQSPLHLSRLTVVTAPDGRTTFDDASTMVWANAMRTYSGASAFSTWRDETVRRLPPEQAEQTKCKNIEVSFARGAEQTQTPKTSQPEQTNSKKKRKESKQDTVERLMREKGIQVVKPEQLSPMDRTHYDNISDIERDAYNDALLMLSAVGMRAWQAWGIHPQQAMYSYVRIIGGATKRTRAQLVIGCQICAQEGKHVPATISMSPHRQTVEGENILDLYGVPVQFYHCARHRQVLSPDEWQPSLTDDDDEEDVVVQVRRFKRGSTTNILMRANTQLRTLDDFDKAFALLHRNIAEGRISPIEATAMRDTIQARLDIWREQKLRDEIERQDTTADDDMQAAAATQQQNVFAALASASKAPPLAVFAIDGDTRGTRKK